MAKRSLIKTCPEGHRFRRSSDCEVCPVCAKAHGIDFFITGLSAPARRALIHHGIKDYKTLSAFTEKELLSWHGIGPAAIPPIQKALLAAGFGLKQQKQTNEKTKP